MISTSYDVSKALTVFKATGEITVQEIIQAIETFYAETPTKLTLWDLRHAENNTVSSEDIDRIIEIIRRHSDEREGGKSALVVSRDFAFGMSRMHIAKTEISKINISYYVTRSIPEAMEWLGL
ncbi:MAG: hypothetical protein HKM93_04520 [Desulfobacteraceae bacterium]|nr:hypothetical protein [Desulfobacteraceae bacterium]